MVISIIFIVYNTWLFKCVKLLMMQVLVQYHRGLKELINCLFRKTQILKEVYDIWEVISTHMQIKISYVFAVYQFMDVSYPLLDFPVTVLYAAIATWKIGSFPLAKLRQLSAPTWITRTQECGDQWRSKGRGCWGRADTSGATSFFFFFVAKNTVFPFFGGGEYFLMGSKCYTR